MRTILALLLLSTAARADCLFEGDKVVDPNGKSGVITYAFCDERLEAYVVTYADGSSHRFADGLENVSPLPKPASPTKNTPTVAN